MALGIGTELLPEHSMACVAMVDGTAHVGYVTAVSEMGAVLSLVTRDGIDRGHYDTDRDEYVPMEVTVESELVHHWVAQRHGIRGLSLLNFLDVDTLWFEADRWEKRHANVTSRPQET